MSAHASDLFNFITLDDFRTSLESDYRELCSSLDAGNWKAVHVLAGSIVEAVLVDYLLAAGHRNPDPLEMPLAKIIDACKTDGVLTEKSANLSTVIRSYRNLIHPGRQFRLQERIGENDSKIARALVDMIVESVAQRKRETYGYTAGQLVVKLRKDSSSPAILGHLLKEVREVEKERLLMNVIPDEYLATEPTYDDYGEYESLKQAFRMIFDEAAYDLKQKVTRRFVQMVKEESQSAIIAYETAFFKAGDLTYLLSHEADLVKGRLVSRLPECQDRASLTVLEGIGQFLQVEDVDLFVCQLVLTARTTKSNDVVRLVEWLLTNECRISVRGRPYMNVDAWARAVEQLTEMVVPHSVVNVREGIIKLSGFTESPPFSDPIPF